MVAVALLAGFALGCPRRAPPPETAPAPVIDESAYERPARGDLTRPETDPLFPGTLDAASVRKIINTEMARIRRCHEVLSKTEELSGKLLVEWTVDAAGKTLSTRVHEDSSLKHRAMEDCVLRIAGSLRFPRPTGGAARISFPFVFIAAES